MIWMLLATWAGIVRGQNGEMVLDVWPDGPTTASADIGDTARVNIFLPPSERATGRAIVICPGGGYAHLAFEKEGTRWAPMFNEMGIAVVVLKYRMPHGNWRVPTEDAEEAVRLVRRHAEEWHVNPSDVGIMGFSAGGHLASVISTHSAFDVRPDFSLLFYPVISMDERISHKWSCINFLGKEGQKDPALVRDFSTMNAVQRHITPPALIISASDDRLVPFVTNGLEYYKAMRNAGNECAMYVYPTGDHGFGFGHWFKYHDQLLTDIGNWLDARQAPKTNATRVACLGNSITDGYGIDMASAYGYPAQLQKKLGQDYWVRNFGVSSRTMLNKGDFPYMNEPAWRDALAFNPDVVIIKLGTNDSKPENWQYGSEFRSDLEQMIFTLRPDLKQYADMPAKKVQKAMAKAKAKAAKAGKNAPARPQIYLCTPIPAFKPTWNINDSVIVNGVIPIQQEVAAKYGLKVIDLHTLYANDGDKMVDDGIHPNDKGAARMADIIAEALKAE